MSDAEEVLSEMRQGPGPGGAAEAPDAGAGAQEPAQGAPDPEPAGDAGAPQGAPEGPAEGGGKDAGGAEGAPREREGPHERNVIFVGTKPIMTYVTATLTQLASQPKVTIKARGKRITQAVDVSQMIVKRMDTVGFEIGGVRIASDSLMSEDGKKRNVSTIEIDVTKGQARG